MTTSTYNELSELRVRLAAQIEAIDILIGSSKKKHEVEKAAIVKAVEARIPPTNTQKPAKQPTQKIKSKRTVLWSKEDAVNFIINTIKVHNNAPLCMDEFVKFAPFPEENQEKVRSIVATTLTSLFYGDVVARVKKNNSRGYLCYHYNFK